MKRHNILFAILFGLATWSVSVRALAAAVDAPADPADWRLVRELQNKADGSPALSPTPGDTGAMLLGASALGASADARLSARDYDALYSLLQRYRDELVGMGLDYDKLVTRLDELKRSTQDLTERMDKLHPQDGLKIHGRAITTYADLHLIGPTGLNFGTLMAPKPLGQGIRYQGGISRADIDFEMTKGPLSAVMEINLEGVWGGDGASAGFRRFYIESRTPVAMQFGNIDTNLTPLTLWRNEDPNPFEPEPFKSRRDRARSDYEMVPDMLRVTGFRLSTELWILDSFTLDLQSTSAVIATPFFAAPGQTSYFGPTVAVAPGTFAPASPQTSVSNATFLEAWRTGFILPAGLDISWNGALFVDDTQSRPLSGYRGLLEMVNTGRVKYEKGPFFADAEIGASTYTAPARTFTAQADPLTGTAIVANAGFRGKWVGLKGYFRSVSPGFHAAGAQTRTQDANFEYMGPLMTEITQINTMGRPLNFQGSMGVGLGMPPAPEPVWNMFGILAPGIFFRSGTSLAFAGTFSHLLPYNFLNDMSPYGMATPDRTGFGLEGDIKFLDGMFVAKAGCETAANSAMVPVSRTSRLWVTDNAGNTAAPVAMTLPFTYTRIRAGLDVNIRTAWPAKISMGWTSNDTRNGDLSWRTDASGANIPFALTSQLLQAGVELHPRPKLTFAVGYQHTDASGFTDTITAYGLMKVVGTGVPSLPGVSYDQMAYSVYWYITDAARVDLLYEDLNYAATGVYWARWAAGSGLIRFQVNF